MWIFLIIFECLGGVFKKYIILCVGIVRKCEENKEREVRLFMKW